MPRPDDPRPPSGETDAGGPGTGTDVVTTADTSRSRTQAAIRAVLVIAYLVVVFGILLPAVVDYGEVLAAFQAAPPEWLLVVALIGVGCWVLEGLAIKALMPGLSTLRSVTAFLAMAAVGNTVPGPFNLPVGYAMFRTWQIPPGLSALALTLNSLLSQVGKLLLPAIAILFLTLNGRIPGWGYLVAVIIMIPVAIGSFVGIWVLRSEAFARRMGALATRASDAVARRIHRVEPMDMTGRLLDFREAARALLVQRAIPAVATQVLVRTAWGVCLWASLRAVGVSGELIPWDVVLGVYAVVLAVTVIPISPGGAGVPELLYIALFSRYVGNDAYTDAITAGVMLFRAFQWFVPIPVGYVALYLHRRANRRPGSAAREAVTSGPGGGIAG
jgi:putative heme transporter